MTAVVTPAEPRSRRPGRRRTTRRLAVVTVLALVAVLLSGCLRAQVSMGVSSDDRVSGRIVVAVIPSAEGDTGPGLDVPDSLSGKIRVQPYSSDGYVGSEALFSDLTFGDVQQLGGLSDQADGLFQLTLTRSGDLVALAGQVDLGTVPADGSDVQFTIAFPARVTTTNGAREGDNVVSWALPAGERSTLRAEVRYSDPNTRSFAGWAGIVFGVTVGVAAIVGGMAYVSRNPALRTSRRPNDAG
ncbi:LppM family (lipo)protein [Rhodococcoides kroppenstedtii]|uniref:LppM family (lipo)protein n=1 Tax=Rhodococcoides kroppenstedtii TaxID=293050 RepID=UPI001BDF350E